MQKLDAFPRREWRKIVKKLQRKRRRQKVAKERDKQLEMEVLAKLSDPAYVEWQKRQTELEEFYALAEQRKHDDEEAEWLRRELLSQQQFRLEQGRRKADEAAKVALRLQQQKELEEWEAAQQKRREERAQLAAEAAAEFELMMHRMDSYLSDVDMETPGELKRCVETRPGQKLCEFYERTNCCRFGGDCSFNHRRPLLGRIILIHHFFSHPLLEPLESGDYAVADAHLESTERDLRDDYDSFFEDVVPELESFGKIRSFCALRNVLPHLRGNVFIEYDDKRSALKAFIKLQGRFYAMKRLIVEFSNLHKWRGAVCGLSIARKCPRGYKCCYLHLFKNPGNKYNCVLENAKPLESNRKSTKMSSTGKTVDISTPLLSWNDICGSDLTDQTRNWRWSESPEKQVPTGQKELSKRNTRKSRDSDLVRRRKSHSEERSEYSSLRQKETNKRMHLENYSKKPEEVQEQKKHESHKRKHSGEKRKRKTLRDNEKDNKNNEKDNSKGEHRSKSRKKHRKKSKKHKS